MKKRLLCALTTIALCFTPVAPVLHAELRQPIQIPGYEFQGVCEYDCWATGWLTIGAGEPGYWYVYFPSPNDGSYDGM